MKIIENRKDVSQLINAFYAKIRKDVLLGPIFNRHIQDENWSEHLTKLTDFWETNLFGIAKFKGNPSAKHINILIMEQKHPLPPFTLETAKQKIQIAEDAWNSQNPEKVSLAYTVDSEWRNRNTFINGRDKIVSFLTKKWKNELEYKLKKEYWSHMENRIAVRFEYEYRNEDGKWFRAYGNENWEFDNNGLMDKRYASINDLEIKEKDRRL